MNWEIDVIHLALDNLAPISESHMVDMVGELQQVARRVAAELKSLRSELDPEMDGDRYAVVETRRAKRSYNTNGLLAAFGGPDALPALLERDVVRLQWRWTQLRQAAEQRNVTLSIAGHEISDGDPDALVGEIWVSEQRVQEEEQ